jgi:hypothetical protein
MRPAFVTAALAIAVGGAELKDLDRVADVIKLVPEKVFLVLCRGDGLMTDGAD